MLLVPRDLEEWEVREAHALLYSAGYRLYAELRYRRHSPSKLLSDAKLREVEEVASKLKKCYDPRIVVYDDIKPRDYMTLVERTGLEVLDRTMLILEIFERNAGSKEAKLQIELARLKHRLPIIREAIRRAKMREQVGFLGPGGYAIDAYYRHAVARIARIRRELERLRERRKLERSRRRRLGYPHVSIVGYASAGKTTLFNKLTGEAKPTGEEYFTTVTPKSKSMFLPTGLKVVVSDTVGFISRVPPEIIEAFHATLEEVTDSDLILFVVDSTEPDRVIKAKLMEGVDVLRRIGAVGKPLIVALNKVDKLDQDEIPRKVGLARDVVSEEYPGLEDVIPVSALKGYGVEALVWRVATLLESMAAFTS